LYDIRMQIMNREKVATRGGLFAGLLILLFLGLSVSAQNSLTQAEVQRVIAQAVSQAAAMNRNVTVSVTDNEAHLLGTFAMNGAPANTLVRSVGRAGQGLENAMVPARDAAVSKAGTAALLSSGGNAFSTRTASFIIQEHFPPGIDNTPGGPLYGVQFSSLLCSDIAISGLRLGLSGDAGGVPLYKNGIAVGGVGVEGDGLYTVDRDPRDLDQPFEEIIAVAATRGFDAPSGVRADNILVAGIRFPFENINVSQIPAVATIPFGSLPGMAIDMIMGAPPSGFLPPTTLNGVQGVFTVTHPNIIAGSALTAAEVTQILGAAAATAQITRAGIRQPIGSNARVNIAVVDTDGTLLGEFSQLDAPVFGLDVAVQKARSVNFISRPDAGAKLTAAGFGPYVARAAADGIPLTGNIAFSDRGFGFTHRPLFPDGINGTIAGPFSSLLSNWSPFNNGLQLDLVAGAIVMPMCNGPVRKKTSFPLCPCTAIPELKNGLQIFAGGVPIYRGNTLIGAVGVSGDGIEQDDLIAASGAAAFAPPEAMWSDKFFVRGVRLPFLKFPPRPFLP
jgi:uncharacterized protein GlcG (DUF336 family)